MSPRAFFTTLALACLCWCLGLSALFALARWMGRQAQAAPRVELQRSCVCTEWRRLGP